METRRKGVETTEHRRAADVSISTTHFAGWLDGVDAWSRYVCGAERATLPFRKANAIGRPPSARRKQVNREVDAQACAYVYL